MCQAYEGEANCMRARDLREIREAWEKHQSGEKPLTEQELKELAVRKLMASEY